MGHKQERTPDAIRTRLREARVARLATLGPRGRPHVVPVCFLYDGKFFYTAIDQKPKRVAPERLVRLRNIRGMRQVALLIDQYDEDWTQLCYILVSGKAGLIPTFARKERASAIHKLRRKYPQYTPAMLSDDALIIRITPQRITAWGQNLASNRSNLA